MTNEEAIVFEERRGQRWNGLGRTIGRDCVITDRRIEDIEEACDNLLPLKKKVKEKLTITSLRTMLRRVENKKNNQREN